MDSSTSRNSRPLSARGPSLAGDRPILRIAAGGSHGTGSLTRCALLLRALLEHDAGLRFRVVMDGPRSLFLEVLALSPDAVWLGESPSWVTEERVARAAGGAPFVILDRRAAPAVQQRLWSRATNSLLVLGDDETAPHAAGIFVHAGREERGHQRLGGGAYALVERVRPTPVTSTREIVVMLGDPGPIDAELAVLSGLATIDDDPIRITVVTERGVTAERIQRCSRVLKAVCVVDDRGRSRALASATLAITSGGPSRWVAASARVPSVLVSLRPNEEALTRAYADRGAGVDLGPLHTLSLNELGASVARLLKYPAALAAFRHAAGSLHDGRGPQRVLELALPRVLTAGEFR